MLNFFIQIQANVHNFHTVINEFNKKNVRLKKENRKIVKKKIVIFIFSLENDKCQI